MSPLYLYFSILVIFSSFLLQVVLTSDDEGFAYDSIRIRDEDRQRFQLQEPQRRPRKPLNHGGGSRFLNRRRKPGRKQLDKSNLMVLMGDDYLTSWMSDERPKKPLISVPSNEVNLDEGQGSWAQERLLDQLQSINLTAELSALEPELLPFEQLVKQWMIKRSSCPVEFSWKDLGPTYWPRWIRKGECANRKGLCSFPTGMHCVPGATTKVMLLFWDCEEAKRRHIRRSQEGRSDQVLKNQVRYQGPVPKLPLSSRRKRSPGSLLDSETSVLYKNRVPHLPPSTHMKKKKRCDWKKVPYPITVDCFCTC